MKVTFGKIYVADNGEKFLDEVACITYELYEMAKDWRKDWIDKHYNDLVSNARSWDSDSYIPQSDVIGVINNIAIRQIQSEGRTSIINLKTGKCGKAYCNNSDEFDSKCGWAVAWARYRGEEIPDYI